MGRSSCRAVELPGKLDGFFAPGVPIHGIPGVKLQVWARLEIEPVRASGALLGGSALGEQSDSEDEPKLTSHSWNLKSLATRAQP